MVCTGFSEPNGSWKTICTCRTCSRNSRPRVARTVAPPMATVPLGERIEAGQQPGHRRLAGARLADERGDLARPAGQGDVVDRVHDLTAAAQPLPDPVHREVLDQTLSLQGRPPCSELVDIATPAGSD